MSDEKLEVVVFSGGRGTASITDALLRHKQLNVTVLLNAYDDGLSTGRLRRAVPGMLGPSDVRKCYARLMPDSDRSDQALRALLEYRLPVTATREAGMGYVSALCNLLQPPALPALSMVERLRVDQARAISSAMATFASHIEGVDFDFGDCGLGNMVFTGLFLQADRSFNRAVDAFGALVRSRARVLNVTMGEDLTLMGIKTDGTILFDEASLVAPQSRKPVRDIYLVREPLSETERARLASLDPEAKHAELSALEIFPEINPECREVLRSADIIIYGPGTQHSSLFPSYVTRGLGESIAQNRHAEKIFIANIAPDVESQSETSASLAHKLVYYMRRKGAVQLEAADVLTTSFVQSGYGHDGAEYLPSPSVLPASLSGTLVVRKNWEETEGQHRGARVVGEIVSIASQRVQRDLKPFHDMISIVVPGLDEAKTLGTVLESLSLLDFASHGLGKEIIYVDGGSRDGSRDIASQVRGVRCMSSRGGRGGALQAGVEAANGNIIAFFPSDGEYQVSDIQRIVTPILSQQVRATFGCRQGNLPNFSSHFASVYGRDRLGYLVGKYGGMLLSLAALVSLDRFVSDVLTGLKAFDARLLRELDVRALGLDYETELLVRLAQKGERIMEVPVSFQGRTKAEGKKTRAIDGVWALARLFQTKS